MNFNFYGFFLERLTGKKPFYSKDIKKLIELNKNSNIDFNGPELMILPLESCLFSFEFPTNITIFKKAVDLLKKMLSFNPKVRLSAIECLSHSFFNKPPEENIFILTNEEWEKYMEYYFYDEFSSILSFFYHFFRIFIIFMMNFHRFSHFFVIFSGFLLQNP